MQDCEKFFGEFFKLFERRKDLQRHIHSRRCFHIGFPKKGSKLEDLQKIKTCIASIVQSVPFWMEDIKPKWAIFEHLLEKIKKEKIVSIKRLSEYNEKLDSDFKLSEDEITDLLKYLNRVGSLLYNNDDEHIRNTVILDVQWFVDAFKCIITDPVDIDKPTDIDREYFHKTGELEDHQLESIWKKVKGEEYLTHKKEILSYMENLGLVAICEATAKSSNAVWYYFPSLNTKTFDKENDISKLFKSSSILCFQFDAKGQLPIFVFYALVSKCNRMNGWAILVEDEKKCIYEKLACFSYRATIVVICICKFQIQVQVFFPPDYNAERMDPIKVEIQTSVERQIRKFKRYTYEIGYKCQNGELFNEEDNCFIEFESFPTSEHLCSKCVLPKKHLVDNSICWVIICFV